MIVPHLIGAVHCDSPSLDFVDDFMLELLLHVGVARRYLCCYGDDNLVWQFYCLSLKYQSCTVWLTIFTRD